MLSGPRQQAKRNEFEIALVDDIDLSVAYYDKVTLLDDPRVSRRHFARNLVWRSASRRHSLALRDISQHVLFGYIVNDYDILVAADTITNGGNFNWHRQASRAIEIGLHVYVYDPATQAFRPIPTQHVLNDVQDQAWSGANQDALRAVISISPLFSRLQEENLG